jgi:hypothetical protein
MVSGLFRRNGKFVLALEEKIFYFVASNRRGKLCRYFTEARALAPFGI